MTTFLVRVEPPPGVGPRLAVKDLIDVAGLPTTCASAPVAARARPAPVDADCVARARAAGARIVGKANLHELAFGGTGVNRWSGTPTNPRDASLVPGGSSSGSAVAVATGEADVALGTDTGGSVRTPAACCGVVGLKTTFGRIPVAGVAPLAPSLDTVGPMAATVAGAALGMALLEPGFAPTAGPATRIGRFRLRGAAAWVEDAIDAALAASGLAVGPVDLPGWERADAAGSTVAFAEAARIHARLLAEHGDELGADVRDRLVAGSSIAPDDLAGARAVAAPWAAELDAVLATTPVVALPAVLDAPPPLTDPLRLDTRRPNVAINLAGHPALVLPVPAGGPDRGAAGATAVQLVGRRGAEDLLLATGAVIEAAAPVPSPGQDGGG